MADIKTAYGATNQAITITLNSLASSATAARQSTVVDNTSNLFLDALVQVKVTLPTSGTISADQRAYIYAFGTADTSTPTYPAEVASASANSSVGASDAAYTMNASGSPLRLIGVLPIVTVNTSTNGVLVTEPMSVASAFGGRLPPKWGIVVRNYCGVTWHSSGCSAWYQGVYATA